MALVTRPVSYHHRETALSGLLFMDEAVRDRRAGILLVHGGGGLDDHAQGQARRYASLGYVVFACDMLGDGVAGDRERVMGRLRELRADPDLLSSRALAGLAELVACPQVDDRIAAIGFCFGGLTVLTMARCGADLAAVVSIHGSLATGRPAEPGAITARVLVCHGALDPHVPMTDVVGFAEEMDRAGADWQLTMYGGAVHGFTHENAIPGATAGVAYDAAADRRSFAAVRGFLTDVGVGL